MVGVHPALVNLHTMSGTDTAARSIPRSDALVFFGATGDLAYKQIFPVVVLEWGVD